MTLTVGSLFSGTGMLEKAIEEVFGATTVWQCEVDPAASKVLAHRFPGVPNLGDITAVDWSAVEPIDILCGGFPCQDVSAAGRRAGIREGTRSGLWLEFAQVIDQLRPRIVVIENVRGLLSGYAHRAVESNDLAMGNGAGRPLLRAAGAVLGDLANLGYDAQWCTVAASDVGAPHRRERVFILATDAADADGWGFEVGTERHGEAQRPELEASQRGDVDGRSATDSSSDGRHEGRPESTGFVGGSDAAVRGDGPVDLLPTPRRSDGDGGANPLYRAERMDDVETRVIRLLQTPSVADGEGSRKARGGERGDEPLLPGQAVEMSQSWGKYEPAIRRWEALTRPAPSPTEPNTKGNPRLSAAFPEWMQGWPNGWVTAPEIDISRNDQLRCIGNGVCPQQAVHALRWLLDVASLVVAS